MAKEIEINGKKIPIWPLMLIFFTSTDTFLFGTNANRIFTYVPRIVALFVILLLPVFTKKLKFNRQLAISVLFCGIIVTSALINGTEFGTAISRILAVIVIAR